MPYRREKKTLPNGKAIGAEEDALQDRGKQHFVEVNRHWRRCPTGERETHSIQSSRRWRRCPTEESQTQHISIEEDAPQEREEHVRLELIGIEEDALQEGAKRILLKLMGIEEDVLQERKNNFLLELKAWRSGAGVHMPHSMAPYKICKEEVKSEEGEREFIGHLWWMWRGMCQDVWLWQMRCMGQLA